MNNNIFFNIAKYCNDNLFNNKDKLAYLVEERKISINAIKKFQLGLFPEDLRKLFSIFDPKDLRNFGIIKNVSNSVFKYQNIIIPIRDVYGNYIALAGRTILSDDKRKKIKMPKYINTVYDKSNHLYGLNFAKKDIVKLNKVYVVEGYFDVIQPNQYNMKNIVAICGSFLSLRHLSLLSRYTNNIILLFDNEIEAKNKARKIIEKKQREGLSLISISPFPNDIKDIDEYLKKYSLKDLLNIINKEEMNITMGYLEMANFNI